MHYGQIGELVGLHCQFVPGTPSMHDLLHPDVSQPNLAIYARALLLLCKL